MLLFFKAIYREPILNGLKTDTIRRNKRLPVVGAIVQACVGPSRIFARLRIIAIEPVDELPVERQMQIRACYGTIEQGMVRICFERL